MTTDKVHAKYFEMFFFSFVFVFVFIIRGLRSMILIEEVYNFLREDVGC